MKTVWVLWGLWPETTSKFYMDLINFYCQKNPWNRPPILIWNIPMSNNIESKFLLTWEWIDKYLSYLVEWAKILEKWWVDFIVIPCNSIHYLIDDIRKSISIPIISIIDETINYIVNKKLSNIWIISSLFTSKSKIYENQFIKNKIDFIWLNNDEQRTIDNIILNLVSGDYTQNDKLLIINIINKLKERWAKNILLACTDLQILVNSMSEVPIYDTMNILTHSTINNM